jgi:hypothetical protein
LIGRCPVCGGCDKDGEGRQMQFCYGGAATTTMVATDRCNNQPKRIKKCVFLILSLLIASLVFLVVVGATTAIRFASSFFNLQGYFGHEKMGRYKKVVFVKNSATIRCRSTQQSTLLVICYDSMQYHMFTFFVVYNVFMSIVVSTKIRQNWKMGVSTLLNATLRPL